MTTKRGLIIACTLLFVLIVGGASRALAQSSSSGAGTAPTATTTPVGSTTPTTQPTTQPNDAASTFAGIVDGGADTPKIVVKSPDGIATPSVSDTSSSSQSTVSINTPKGASNAVLLVLLVSLVAILPGLLLLTTTFPRFLIVLGLTRQGLGLNTTPPNQVLAGLAAFLTLFVMGPVFSKINDTAIQPAIKGELTQGEAIKKGWEPLRDFMLDHTRTSDLAMLYDLTDSKRPADVTKVSPRFVIPAFILSELRAAFMIGFLIWVPFLLIDLIVSTVLASLGMLMMPPVVVSLPVKLALFVLVDGWALLAGSLLKSAMHHG